MKPVDADNPDRTRLPVRAAGAAVIMLAILNGQARPDKAAVWGGVMVLVAVVWAAVEVLPRVFAQFRTPVAADIRRSLFVAALTIGFTLFASLLKQAEWIDGDGLKRMTGAVIGGVLLVTGNYLPKTALPASARRNPAVAMETERFAGRVLFIGGLGYVAAWMIGPVEHAQLVSTLIGLLAFALVISAWARLGISCLVNDQQANEKN